MLSKCLVSKTTGDSSGDLLLLFYNLLSSRSKLMEVSTMIVYGVYCKAALWALGFIVFTGVLNSVTTKALKEYK